MVITEYYKTREDGVVLNRTYSTEGLRIRKVGTDEVYDEAIDPSGANREYIETDEPVEQSDEI